MSDEAGVTTPEQLRAEAEKRGMLKVKRRAVAPSKPEREKKPGGPSYSTVGKARDVPAYLLMARRYCETAIKLRSIPRVIEQAQLELRALRGPDGKIPGVASLRRWADFGVEIDNWNVFAQPLPDVAAAWDRKDFDFDVVEGQGGPGPLINAQNALSDAVMFTRRLLQRDEYLETAARNPKVHVEMMGKLSEAVHKLSMTGAGFGGRKPQDMTADEAFEAVCSLLEAHPELIKDVVEAYAKK